MQRRKRETICVPNPKDYADVSSHLSVTSRSRLFYSVPDVISVAIPRILLYMAVVTCLILPVSAQTFGDCLNQIRAGLYGSTGITDNNGNPSNNTANATAITYELCCWACGTGPSPFQWSSFSQKFSSWLLPWLALVSQLPFGAKFRHDNLLSAILAIGSPMLAAYSLALTVLNELWVVRRFSGFKYPNRHHVIRILMRLQQVSMKVVQEDALLSSLVILPENDAWWEELSKSLGYNYTWSIASATAIFWVVIAFVFTLINSFQSIANAPNLDVELDGQAIGLIWHRFRHTTASWRCREDTQSPYGITIQKRYIGCRSVARPYSIMPVSCIGAHLLNKCALRSTTLQ
jgi:hypothetical protein